MSEPYQGASFCGAVRFEIGEIFDVSEGELTHPSERSRGAQPNEVLQRTRE